MGFYELVSAADEVGQVTHGAVVHHEVEMGGCLGVVKQANNVGVLHGLENGNFNLQVLHKLLRFEFGPDHAFDRHRLVGFVIDAFVDGCKRPLTDFGPN